jgi:serine/threonine-protein kinase RsbW
MADSSSSSEQPKPSFSFDADALNSRLSVTFLADRNAVDAVVRSVMEVIREMKCNPGTDDDIELALTEALANAVVHGAKNDASKLIECDVACDDEHGILIIVRDPGPGFDPGKIPNPCEGENLYSNHGRGIYLINQLMDKVEFHKNGTEIRMLKK